MSEDKNISFGRELLKKSIHMATTCHGCADKRASEGPNCANPDYEKRLWTIACSYVQKAQEVIPMAEWSKLTELEQTILTHGVPHPMTSKFFEEGEEGKDSAPNNNYPPIPSQWENIQDLKLQIRSLECEREKLESYKTAAQSWRTAYEGLNSSHDSYRERAQKEQSTLQTEIKQLMAELEMASEHKQDAVYLERELGKMREKIATIHTNNYNEMTRLRVEIDTVNHERESLSLALQNTQRKVMEMTHEIQTLNAHIEKYQEVLQFIVPGMGDDLQEQLRELLRSM